MKGLMNNPVRIVSDMKMVRQGRLAKALCAVRKHRVIKSKGIRETWSCARKDCDWSK